MPECIVCKGYYHSGTVCTRCGSDNGAWIMWQKSEPVEQEGLWGLLCFTEPHCHLPFLITATALAFGLMGIAGIWEGVNLAVQLLAVATTVGVCMITIQGVYARRHELREEYLLEQVQTTSPNKKPQQIPKIRLSARVKTMLIPVMVVVLILLIAYALVQSDFVWKVSAWLFLEPREGTPIPPFPEDVRERVRGGLPLVLLIGYVGLFLTLVYSSSMMLAQEYAERMNAVLPHPIFLQGDLLARVVQEEAQRHLSRSLHPSTARRRPTRDRRSLQTGHDLEQETAQKSEGWTWEELQRTDRGGIKFTAWGERDGLRVEESITGHRAEYPQFVSYTIEADAWGRIVGITRSPRAV
jgi:hypothetical protein